MYWLIGWLILESKQEGLLCARQALYHCAAAFSSQVSDFKKQRYNVLLSYLVVVALKQWFSTCRSWPHWEKNNFSTRVSCQKSCILDIYITTHNSSKTTEASWPPTQTLPNERQKAVWCLRVDVRGCLWFHMHIAHAHSCILMYIQTYMCTHTHTHPHE